MHERNHSTQPSLIFFQIPKNYTSLKEIPNYEHYQQLLQQTLALLNTSKSNTTLTDATRQRYAYWILFYQFMLTTKDHITHHLPPEKIMPST